MATSARVIDNLPKFANQSKRVLDDALNEGARDVLVDSKNRAPFLKGPLRSSARLDPPKPLSRTIRFNIEYALFQEAGGDGKRRVRNYTTSGTGAHFLRDAADKVQKRMPQIFKKHAGRVR